MDGSALGKDDDESRYSGSNDVMEFSKAEDGSHTSGAASRETFAAATLLARDGAVDASAKEHVPTSISALPPDLQVDPSLLAELIP